MGVPVWISVLVFFLLLFIILFILVALASRNQNCSKCGGKHKYGEPCKGNTPQIRPLGLFGSILFNQKNIASDIDHSAHQTNTNTVNSWGVLHRKTGKKTSSTFVVNNHTSTIQEFSNKNVLLNTFIVPGPSVMQPLGSPTGIAYNKQPTAFQVGSATATLFTCTEDGFVYALVPSVDPINLQLVIDNSSSGAVYKGIAMSKEFIYLANFNSGFIDVYDTNFAFVQQFTETALFDIGYAPFNVMVLTDSVWVSYAQQDNAKHDDVPGIGNGYVNVFSSTGTFIKRLLDRGYLNSPWGMTTGVTDTGLVLLVGNFGNGQIHAWNMKKCGKAKVDLSSIQYEGALHTNGSPDANIIDGLWGITLVDECKSTKLFFAAGTNQETHGLYGELCFKKTSTATLLYSWGCA